VAHVFSASAVQFAALLTWAWQDGKSEQVPLFVGNEDVRGTVHLKRPSGKKVMAPLRS
jgi:hypothetical protein